MARHVTVRTGTRAVVTVDGLVGHVLDPGRHRLRGRSSRRHVEVVDVREQLVVLTSQEAAAADAPGGRFSVALRWRTEDPGLLLTVATAPLDDLRLAAQVAARDWIAARPLEEVLVARAAATAELTREVAVRSARLGVSVLEVALRDLAVPGEVRRGLLDVAVARHEAESRLVRARGETAALRALANGSRALRDDPALLQLRTVQSAVERGGHVVLHVGSPG